jgi:hypothetical protein
MVERYAVVTVSTGAFGLACRCDTGVGSGVEGVEDVVEGGVVGGVLVDVRVAHLVAGSDDERRAELGDPLPPSVDPVAAGAGSTGPGPGATVAQEAEERDLAHRRGVGGVGVVVDEDRERDMFVVGERGGVAAVTGADGDDLGAEALDLVVVVAQLRGVLAAQQSTEVAEEHEDDGPVGPVVPEPVGGAVGVLELHVGERGQIHGT